LSEGHDRLFVLPLAGTGTRPVVTVPGALGGLAWTPDGKHLVFVSDGDLWRVRADGGGGEAERLLTSGSAFMPAVSPRGHRLAYMHQTTSSNIWRLRLADTTRPAGPPERLVSSSRSQRLPTFSPDGTRLAFESNRSGAQEIWMSAADGSDPVQLTSFGGPLTGSPEWSPDGRQIAFDSRATGKGALYVVGSAGGPPRRVVTGVVGDNMHPAWSRDGRSIYFTGVVGQAPAIFKVASQGGPTVQITKPGAFVPHLSPDGRRVYYLRDLNRGEIWSDSADGGDERPVPGAPPRAPRWSMHWLVSASGIYLLEGDPPRPGIHFLDFATGQLTRVTDIDGRPEAWVGGLALSPDGRSLLYTQTDDIASDIMLIEGFR
jgi:Tol biopolymer transport system component